MATARADPSPKRRASYHHGNLRAALIEAAIQLIEKQGAEAVTMREVARQAGVSSGAPFRHFASRKALMTAVAEEAMAKLRAEIERRLGERAPDGPFAGLLALADAYVDWAVDHPTHYRVLGDRPLVDFYRSEALVRDNRWIRETMLGLFAAAQARSLLRDCDIGLIAFQCRAMAYGLARMHVDAHLAEFGIAPEKARGAMIHALKEFLIGLARDPEIARGTALRR
jgi:AcrR family transcriptional regulator